MSALQPAALGEGPGKGQRVSSVTASAGFSRRGRLLLARQGLCPPDLGLHTPAHTSAKAPIVVIQPGEDERCSRLCARPF